MTDGNELIVKGNNTISAFLPNRNITIQGEGSEPLLVIDLDAGTVKTKDSFTATEAAKVFVNEIKRLVSPDPRDTLIEAQREWIEWAINTLSYWGVTKLDKEEGREIQARIQAAEKAIKGEE